MRTANFHKLHPSPKIILYGATAPTETGPPHYRRVTITLRHITRGRTPPDE